MINAHAEIGGPAHAAYAVIVGQKRWMLLEMFVDLARSAGHPDPYRVGEQLMLLHEGAVVTSGMRAIDEAFERATNAVSVLLTA